MPLVAFPVILFAVGAMICYLLAQPITRGLFVSAAEAVPVIGKYLARGVLATEQAMIDLFKHYVWSSTVTFVHWLHGLATNIADFPREVRLFADGLADDLEHLLTSSVPALIRAAIADVRGDISAARNAADAAAAAVTTLGNSIGGRISRAVDAGIAGIWATVHSIVNAATAASERILTAYADDVAGHAEDIARGIGDDVRGLEHALGDLVNPRVAAETIAGAAAAAGVVALVETQVMPLVRDLTECAPKLKATCQTDFSEWLGLLEGMVALAAVPSLLELAREAQATVLSFEGDVADLAGIGSAVGNIPLDPRDWL